MRDGYSKGEYFCTANFGNSIKFMVIMVPSILAYHYQKGSDLFYYWLAASIFMTAYTYYWDLKFDWTLLDFSDDNKHCLLRKYLTYETALKYYIAMVGNLLMRLTWLLTISPNIVAALGHDNLFTFLLGSIEVLRRGIWIVLIMETVYLQNCKHFQAIPNIQAIEQELAHSTNQSQKQL